MINVKRQEDAFGKIKKKTVESKIKDIFSISAGGDIDQKLVYSERTKDNNVPIYANSLINNGLYGYTSNAKITDESITVTGRGSIGHAKYRKESYYPIVRLLSLISKEKIDYKYMEENINMINILQESTGVPQLTAPQLGSYKISVHEIKIQEKIGKHLTAIDELIQKQEEYIQELNSQKNAYTQKIFAHNLNEQIKIKKLKEVAKVTMGQSPSSSEYNYEQIGKPLIQGNADIKKRKTNPRIYSKVGTKECTENSIIMSVRAPAGTVSRSTGNYYLGRGVAQIDSKMNDYLYQYLMWYEEKWAVVSTGSTFDSINSESINDLPIKVYISYEKIGSFLTGLDEHIELQEKKLENFIQRKKYYLNKIF